MALYDSKKVVVAVKYGGTATGTDAVSVTNEDVRVTPTSGSGSFKELNGKLGNKTTWMNTDDTTGEVTVEGFLLGNDGTGAALDTPPVWDDIYKICGLDEAIETGLSVSYVPSQSQPSDLSSVAIWRDGRKRVLTGAVGTLTISGNIGEPIKQSAVINGFTTITSVAEANPSATSIDETLLLVLKSIDTVTISGVAVKAQSFTLTQSNDNQKQYFVGYKDYERVDFDSTLEVTYLKENEDVYTAFAAGSTVPVIIKAGAVNGKKVQITCGQAVVDGTPTETSINGKEAFTVKYSLQGDATGENQFQIKYGTIA